MRKVSNLSGNQAFLGNFLLQQCKQGRVSKSFARALLKSKIQFFMNFIKKGKLYQREKFHI